MRWSLPIITIKGTAVRLHISFLLFLLWLAGSAYGQAGLTAGLSAFIFFVLLFFCVTLHEFGHILTARNFWGQNARCHAFAHWWGRPDRAHS